MSYSRGKAMWQAYSKHYLLSYQNFGKCQEVLSYAQGNSTSNEIFFKKMVLPVFSPRENFMLLSYHWLNCFFATTYCVASIAGQAHLAYLIQQPKL